MKSAGKNGSCSLQKQLAGREIAIFLLSTSLFVVYPSIAAAEKTNSQQTQTADSQISTAPGGIASRIIYGTVEKVFCALGAIECPAENGPEAQKNAGEGSEDGAAQSDSPISGAADDSGDGQSAEAADPFFGTSAVSHGGAIKAGTKGSESGLKPGAGETEPNHKGVGVFFFFTSAGLYLSYGGFKFWNAYKKSWDIHAGTQFDDLTVLDKLGEGGLGIVYSAVSTIGGRFAIKVLKRDKLTGLTELQIRQRALEEAKNSVRFEHSNIIGAIRFGIKKRPFLKPYYYIVFPFVTGKPLSAMI